MHGHENHILGFLALGPGGLPSDRDGVEKFSCRVSARAAEETTGIVAVVYTREERKILRPGSIWTHISHTFHACIRNWTRTSCASFGCHRGTVALWYVFIEDPQAAGAILTCLSDRHLGKPLPVVS